jgi:hypothetical protein
MKKEKNKTKKKVFINGEQKKIDYEAYMIIRDREAQLQQYEMALFKYTLIHNAKETHTDDEVILYDYCMQLETIKQLLALHKEKVDKKT